MLASFDAAIAALWLAVEGVTRQYWLPRMIESARRRVSLDIGPSPPPILESLGRVCLPDWSHVARTGRRGFGYRIQELTLATELVDRPFIAGQPLTDTEET